MKTRDLREFDFLTIRRIRSKARVETRIIARGNPSWMGTATTLILSNQFFSGPYLARSPLFPHGRRHLTRIAPFVGDRASGAFRPTYRIVIEPNVSSLPPPETGRLRISQGVHAYLNQHDVPHIWNVDDEGHTPTTWASNLYHFAQRIFR